MDNSDNKPVDDGSVPDVLHAGEAAIAHLAARTGAGRSRRAVAAAALASVATVAGVVTAEPAAAADTVRRAPILSVKAKVGKKSPIVRVTIATGPPLPVANIGPVVPSILADIVQVDLVAIPHPTPACDIQP